MLVCLILLILIERILFPFLLSFLFFCFFIFCFLVLLLQNMILEWIRGTISPGYKDQQTGESIDSILQKNLQLSRTQKMVELRIQRGLSVHQEYNALTSSPQLSAAHQFSRASVPRRM